MFCVLLAVVCVCVRARVRVRVCIGGAVFVVLGWCVYVCAMVVVCVCVCGLLCVCACVCVHEVVVVFHSEATVSRDGESQSS